MDALRVILIVIGIVIVTIVYLMTRRDTGGDSKWPRLMKFNLPFRWSDLFSRWRGRGKAAHEARSQHQTLDDETLDDVGRFVPERRPLDSEQVHSDEVKAGIDSDHIAPGGEELVISLTVLAKDDVPFGGEAIQQAAGELGLQFGAMNIYHRYADAGDESGAAVCSVANMFEPGHLRMEEPAQFYTSGLALFMVLPGPQEPRQAFETLLETGQGLAQRLGGELCDEQRSVLTKQTIGHLKERIESYRFKQRMAHLQQRGAKQ